MKMKRFILWMVLLAAVSVWVSSRDASIHDLKKAVVRIGQLPFKTDLPVRYIDKKQLEKYIIRIFDQDYPDEMAEKDAFFLYTMGFVPRKINIKKARKRILINNIGGLYNEKTGELFALKEYREVNRINAMVIIHELRHSIQDQHFDLSRVLGTLSDFDDRKLAVLAAVEGDASLVMVEFGGMIPDLLTSYHADALLSFSPLSNTAVLYDYPDILKHQLTMPYISGLKFTHALFKKKKWKVVNRILKSPPVSSEQVIHPEKYLKGEQPVPVKIGFKPDRYTLYHSGVIGEFYLGVLIKGGGEFLDLARGWGGDRFEIFRRPSHYVLLWESLWDKEKFAGNYLAVFRQFLEREFLIDFKAGNVGGVPFIAGHSQYGYFFLRRFKDKLFFLRTNDRQAMNQFINRGYYD
jgi:hypothetical protein